MKPELNRKWAGGLGLGGPGVGGLGLGCGAGGGSIVSVVDVRVDGTSSVVDSSVELVVCSSVIEVSSGSGVGGLGAGGLGLVGLGRGGLGLGGPGVGGLGLGCGAGGGSIVSVVDVRVNGTSSVVDSSVELVVCSSVIEVSACTVGSGGAGHEK
ncbi:hypothetical protein MRX96_059641 [Rhipicephalus microplus]